MGCNLLRRSSDYRYYNNMSEPTDPDPKLFSILKWTMYPPYTIVLIHYPNCTNYEGKKLLVYKESILTLQSLKEIDPHFLENKISPIARFQPTEEGWKDAVNFAKFKGNYND